MRRGRGTLRDAVRQAANAAVLLSAALVALSSSRSVLSAQSSNRDPESLPRVFVGGGVAPATSDAEARMRLGGKGASVVWVAEGGAALTPRLGIGIESAVAPTISASTRGSSFHASGRQQERVLLGLARGRVYAVDRWALDLVGGGGVLFQKHQLSTAPCSSGCPPTREETVDRRAPAVILGGDMPFRIASHLWVGATVRWYLLRRREHQSAVPILVPWQYEARPSNRLAIGVTGRAGW